MVVIADWLFADMKSIDLLVLEATSVVDLRVLFDGAIPNEAAESMIIY